MNKKSLLLIVSLAIINYIIGIIVNEIVFNSIRIVLILWSGWYFVYKKNSNLRTAALGGIIILAIDHVILKGGFFLLAQIFRPELVGNQGILAFGGVLGSFIIFSPIAALISLSGGIIAKRMKSKTKGIKSGIKTLWI